MNEQKEAPKLLSYGAIAKRLGKSRDTIKKWSEENFRGFPTAKYLCASPVIKEDELIAWLDEQLTATPRSVRSKKAAEAA
jgi:hypothetical protein